MSVEIVAFVCGLIGAGLFAGFVGGLFGVGGGIVIVPALYLVFGALGVPDEVRMHLAIGTSLSTIIATSWRSLSAHAKASVVDHEILRLWTPWIACGAAAGAATASIVNATVLLFVFGVGLLIVAAQFALASPSWRAFPEMPRGKWRAAAGVAIGGLSALMGIGGGAFGATLMTLSGRAIHQAVATASGFGAAIAIPAAVGYVVLGWDRAGLPPGSLGFVSLPGFAVLASLTAITAPVGARLAHRLPQRVLKLAFALFLAVVAANMIREALVARP